MIQVNLFSLKILILGRINLAIFKIWHNKPRQILLIWIAIVKIWQIKPSLWFDGWNQISYNIERFASYKPEKRFAEEKDQWGNKFDYETWINIGEITKYFMILTINSIQNPVHWSLFICLYFICQSHCERPGAKLKPVVEIEWKSLPTKTINQTK